MQWSSYQQDIFDAVARTNDSLIIDAVAGSGKTTTIVEAIKHVRDDQSVVFLAFNKAIATALASRVTSPNARCLTLHAAGFAAWRNHLGADAKRIKVESRKTSNVMRDVLTDAEYRLYGGNLSRIVSIAKNAGMTALMQDTDENWEDLIDFYGIDIEWEDLPQIVDCARRVLKRSIEDSTEEIDFDDMLYMPIIAGAKFDTYDVIFVDEAQDVSGIQLEMIVRMRESSSRVIAVGDPCQSIYSFRGALQDSMDKMSERFDCRTLPLSVSYRCPKAVVDHARRLVPHIESFEGADLGVVQSLDFWKIGDFKQSDVILCRLTRPLVAAAFLLIRNKIPCKMLGRDIGNGLVTLVKRMKAKDLKELIERLSEFREREVVRLKGSESRIAAMDDKLSTIEVFMEGLPGGASVGDLVYEIESLFTDSDATHTLTLSTVHKAKGMEFPRVFILDAGETMPSKWAKRDHEIQQERNIHYVAITRAMGELYYLNSGDMRNVESKIPEEAHESKSV